MLPRAARLAGFGSVWGGPGSGAATTVGLAGDPNRCDGRRARPDRSGGMTKMITQAVGRASPERALRNVLRADGLLCGASGLVLLVGAQPVATMLGVGAPASVAAIGSGLVLYGRALLWRARRERVEVRPVVTAAVL